MRIFFKIAALLALLAAASAAAVLTWATHHLSRDTTAGRPQYANFEMGNGAADGSRKPDATGYIVDETGRGRILPPMPPEKPQDVHNAANYRHDLTLRSCFWPGPRARNGVFTNDGDAVNFENQFPDTQTTYIPTTFRLPAGATLVVKGEFPHMRHWNFNTYNAKGEPQDAVGDAEVEPDAGSSNPFRAGVARDVVQRRYTLNIVNGLPPASRPANTLYTYGEPGEEVFLWMRNYVPDHSTDYLGAVALPAVRLHAADGKVLDEQATCDATAAPMRGKQLPSTIDPRSWVILSHLPWVDTDNVGASRAEVVPLHAFFNRRQVAADLFMPWLSPAEPKVLGGWWSNKATRYGYAYMSRNFGKVYVMTARMPVTPKTWHGEADNMPNADMRYLSICTGTSPSAGLTPDCIYDEQLAPTVDARGRYALVISRLEDRPKNATEACGVAWIEYGNGDGMPGGSAEFGAVINRNTEVNPAFGHSWFAVQKPGAEKQAMGDYLPYLINMKEKENFEALGCPVDKARLWSKLPNG
ncbi:MAG: hypothetical protein JO269_12930 [Burkholderiaceae bacterium]|nr:hypothetical protein [Burkholderiaceae bacterium]